MYAAKQLVANYVFTSTSCFFANILSTKPYLCTILILPIYVTSHMVTWILLEQNKPLNLLNFKVGRMPLLTQDSERLD